MDVALVDLDFAELDAFRARLAERMGGGADAVAEAARARVRLVLAQSGDAPAFAWAGLCGAPRAGETGRLGEVVVDAVVIAGRSARKEAVARLAAALGARVLVLPDGAATGEAREARP